MPDRPTDRSTAQHLARPTATRRAVLGAAAVFGTGALTACGSEPTPTAVTDTGVTEAAATPSSATSSSAAAPTTTPSSAKSGQDATSSSAASTSTSTSERATTSTTKRTTTTTTKKPTSSTTTKKATTKTTTKAPAPVDVKLSEIPVGGTIVRNVKGRAVVLTRPSSSSVRAFSAKCPHAGCTVNPAGSKLSCPCHGSQFSASSGALLQGPATRGLSSIRATVRDGGVTIG
jgi:Rieske Fe-S protein